MFESIFSLAAAGMGIVSAVCWIRTARAEVPAPKGSGVGGVLGGGVNIKNTKGVLIDLHQTYRAQAKWNGLAAYTAAATAFLVAAAALSGVFKL